MNMKDGDIPEYGCTAAGIEAFLDIEEMIQQGK